jgi:hypothetical protein
MVRSAAFLLLCAPLTLLAQTTEILDHSLLLHPQAICPWWSYPYAGQDA